MKITDEDKELILKLDNIRQRGLYCSSNTLRDLYNRVFETNWKGTSCSSCMRQKISELVKALTKWEANNAKNAAKLVEKPTEVAEEATENTDDTNDKVIDTQDIIENKEAEQQPPEITEEKKDATVKRTSKKKSSRKKGR